MISRPGSPPECKWPRGSILFPHIVTEAPPDIGQRAGKSTICEEIDGTWAWVAPRPERQPDVTAGVPETAEDALVADEGAPAVPAPMQAPQPPPPAVELTRTMAQSMARDFSRFSTWTVVGLSQMMSQAGVRYTSYADFQIPYARRTRRRTDGASTFTAQQDEQQPDP
ncbi:hypothetical protein Tco_0744695 [Tanacetum coccineum]